MDDTPIYDQLVREQEQQCTPDQGDPQPDASPSRPSEQPS